MKRHMFFKAGAITARSTPARPIFRASAGEQIDQHYQETERLHLLNYCAKGSAGKSKSSNRKTPPSPRRTRRDFPKKLRALKPLKLGRDGALRRPRRVQRRNNSARCFAGGDIAARCPYQAHERVGVKFRLGAGAFVSTPLHSTG